MRQLHPTLEKTTHLDTRLPTSALMDLELDPFHAWASDPLYCCGVTHSVD